MLCPARGFKVFRNNAVAFTGLNKDFGARGREQTSDEVVKGQSHGTGWSR